MSITTFDILGAIYVIFAIVLTFGGILLYVKYISEHEK